jgi:hypothetical protein
VHAPRRGDGEHDLADVGAVQHCLEALAGLGERERRLDPRAKLVLYAEAGQPLELGAGSHCRADDRELKEEDAAELGGWRLAAGRS